MAYKNKEDQAAFHKAYRLANKEKLASYYKTWQKNNEENTSYQKTWREANPEKMIERNKKYYLKLNLMNKNISRRTLAAWSAQVRARDCACLYCGSTSKLHAHHILSKVKHPEHALFLDNGITLCEPCHIQEHILNGEL